jgi:hypothetical protein
MQLPIVVESIGSDQFRAYGLPPFTATSEGKTSKEAVDNLRQELQKEMAAGKQIMMIDVPAPQENPWLAMAGWLKDDPLFDEWRAEVEAYRKQCDDDAGIDLEDRS